MTSCLNCEDQVLTIPGRSPDGSIEGLPTFERLCARCEQQAEWKEGFIDSFYGLPKKDSPSYEEGHRDGCETQARLTALNDPTPHQEVQLLHCRDCSKNLFTLSCMEIEHPDQVEIRIGINIDTTPELIMICTSCGREDRLLLWSD